MNPRDGGWHVCGLRIIVSAFCRSFWPHWVKTSSFHGGGLQLSVKWLGWKVWGYGSWNCGGPTLGLGIIWGLKWRSSSFSVLIHEWGESGATDWWMNWSDGDAAPVCGKERSKHKGRQIYWSIYIPVLWPWAVGSDSSFLLIADTINRNEVPQKGVWVRSLSSTCWGGAGFWPGCLLDAS